MAVGSWWWEGGIHKVLLLNVTPMWPTSYKNGPIKCYIREFVRVVFGGVATPVMLYP